MAAPHDCGGASSDTTESRESETAGHGRPYKIHTVLTDNGTHFVDNTPAPAAIRQPEPQAEGSLIYRRHAFEYACEQLAIEHRLTRPNHPWTNGQLERMNRTLKEATVKRYYYESDAQLREHLDNFLKAYNFAKRLKTLHGLTPYEHIIQCWQKEPLRFKINPHHHNVGLNDIELFVKELRNVVRRAFILACDGPL